LTPVAGGKIRFDWWLAAEDTVADLDAASYRFANALAFAVASARGATSD
jgi:hypothetical protein